MRGFNPAEFVRDPRGLAFGHLGYEITVSFTGDTMMPQTVPFISKATHKYKQIKPPNPTLSDIYFIIHIVGKQMKRQVFITPSK